MHALVPKLALELEPFHELRGQLVVFWLARVHDDVVVVVVVVVPIRSVMSKPLGLPHSDIQKRNCLQIR
jgi:hypothetical protein